MSLSCNPELRALLNAAANKLAWVDALNTAMGNVRTIRCFRDSDPNAANPFATGVEFRNVTSTGALTTAAGQVTGLGQLKGTAIATAADMSTGKSILRIEGNGHWLQGTLGLSKEAQMAMGATADQVKSYDFTVSGNFTANNGLGVRAGLAISGPRFLPSGTGPAAPDVTADPDAPYSFEVWNWENENAPFLVGTTILDRRDDDFVYEDADIASEKGDIAVWQTTSGVLHWQHEFGFTLLASHAGNTESGTKPLYQVIGAAAVRADWTGYPRDTYWDKSKHTAFPKPFKVVMKNKAGTVLHTFEMHDGLPINSPQCSQTRSTTAALRPHWDTAQQLVWVNETPSRSTQIERWYAGLDDRFLRPSIAKKNYAFNGVEPLITGGYQGNNMNGLHHMFATPQWPLPDVDFQPDDPYLDDFNARWPPHANSWDGWGYEPGSFSQHNRYTGPGGVRQDRGFIPSILAYYITTPAGNRISGNVPWKTVAWEFCMAYANHSGHWVTNPNTLQLADTTRQLFDGTWLMSHEYYSSHYYANPNQIDVRADMRDGDNDTHRDYTGHFVWNGSGRDGLHMYCQAGWASLIFNSPMHTLMGKWDAFYALKGGAGNWDPHENFMVRSMAWIWLHFAIMWKLSSKHRLGIDRALIEELFSNHLLRVYEDLYVPIEVNNEQSLYAEGIRKLGTHFQINNGKTEDAGGGLGYYIAHVMMLMKQTGFWQAMYNKGGHCKTALDYQITVMDRKYVSYIADTSAAIWHAGYQNFPDGDPVPTDWTDYVNKYTDWTYQMRDSSGNINAYGVGGQADMFHGPDGSVWAERDVAVWPAVSYVYIRRDYFPEYANPRVATACAKLDNWLAAVKSNVDAGANEAEKRSRDHTYAWGAIAPLKAPAKVGP